MKTVYVAWRNPLTTAWYPIGRIQQTEDMYHFVYLKGAQLADGFKPLIQFPDFETLYQSSTLFPVFSNRLMVQGREDFYAYLNWLKLDPHQAGGLPELALSGGARVGDTFELFAVPEGPRNGNYEIGFFLHGARHLPVATQKSIDSLLPATQLQLIGEPSNKWDQCAQKIFAGDLFIGYVPKYLSCDIAHLIVSGAQVWTLTVDANNADAPMSHRVYCRFCAPWPSNFVPLSGSEYQALEPHETE
jgi:hypothetical protein